MKKTILKKNLRSKKQIASDYLIDLVKYGIIKLENQTFEKYLQENEDQVLGLLLEKLYETEIKSGQTVSTIDAFFHFCEYVIRTDPITKKKIWNPFVSEVFTIIEHNQFSCFMAPRGHGKSYVAFVLYPIFKSFLVEYFDAILCSNIPKMTKLNFRKLVRLIDGNELLLEKKSTEMGNDLTWNDSEIDYNNGYIYTLTLGSTPRGGHVCYVVGDDPLRDDNKYSEEHIENFFMGQMRPTIMRRKGRMVICGTPQSKKDLFHSLMRDKEDVLISDGRRSVKGFFSKKFRAIVDEKAKKVLLPEIFSYEDLIEERDAQGDILFNREYQCECITDDTTLFPYTLIKNCTDNDEYTLFKGESNRLYCIGVDVATSAEASADYSGFVVLEVSEDKDGESKKIVRHVTWVKGMRVPDQIDRIQSLAKDFNNAYVLVEKNNVGVALIQELENRSVNVAAFVTDKFKKEGMIRFLSNELRRKRFVFPEPSYEIEMLKKELENFGVRIKSGKEVLEAMTGHDDLVIATAIANLASQEMNQALAFAIVQD